MSDVIAQHISKAADVCGGRACIAGHRVRVMDIVVLHERRGMSPEEIAHQYPGITLADIHAALAYYFDHREEIEEEFLKDDEWSEWMKANVPSKLRERLGG